MAGCNCGGKTTKWKVQRPNGTSAIYESQSEAAADVRAHGGTYFTVVG